MARKTKPLQFDMELIKNPARREALFAAARAINPKVDGYVGTDEFGHHHMQERGNSTPIIVTDKI